MGGIDEAALDKLSLVTEMTKHIRVRASSPSQGASASEIGQFSPLFLWLLRVGNFDQLTISQPTSTCQLFIETLCTLWTRRL